MALDPIVIGCDWSSTITVEPTDGRTIADVTDDLTGATVTAALYDSNQKKLADASASVASASDRTLSVALSAATTATLTPTKSCSWDIRVSSAGKVLPVSVYERVDVQPVT